MSFLKVAGIHKKRGSDFELKDISFTQQQFQKIAVAGETGSGKSTLLKIIAGLINPDEGAVFFKDERLKKVPEEKLIPGHKGISYLSQHFELPNYLTVEQVLSYANLLPEKEAGTLYDIFRIGHLLKRRTDRLSGGEKQRIAMARLLISSPGLLVLDEPFSNLDMIHKNLLKTIIRDIGEKLHTTCILSSHDPLDSLSWADGIIVMKDGQIVQHGSPEQIYRQPVNEYVAGLFGKYNLIRGSDRKTLPGIPGISMNGKDMLIRPEDIHIAPPGNTGFSGKVKEIFFFGSYYETEVMVNGNILLARMQECHFRKNDEVDLLLSPDDVWHLK